MDIEIAFTGIPVTDLVAAVDFFARLLGRPADVDVNENEVMWGVADGAWLYVVVDEERAGRALVNLSVRDLDGVLAELESRGMVPARVEDVGHAGRRATMIDPDGNSISVLEIFDQGSAEPVAGPRG